MRIISKTKLIDFWEQHRESEEALKAWYAETKNSEWKMPDDIKQKYRSVDIIADNRVVFNIKGNNFRLVVKIHYNTKIVYIRFIGTHAEYDKIDAEKI